ncbi:MAG TPA: hypothetical protein VJQ82_05615 [Terriglobales bacterium]|nr:hypothetical protein [Terriglobales bacterium]
MALIIPTGSSTFGDATSTEGGRLRKYVLAQLRADAKLEWVAELRARLVKDELKYADFRAARPQLRANRGLWSRIEHGVSQATVIVIDPHPVEQEIRQLIEAEMGTVAAGQLDERFVTDLCASAIVANTPIAHLPESLARAVPWSAYDPVGNLEAYTPQEIQARIGPSLRQAEVFAARAHAMFDLKTADHAVTTDSIFRSPLAPVMLAELVSTVRTYDQENPTSVAVLNDAANEIALRVEGRFPEWDGGPERPLVREVSSRTLDELQAADIAAGWARDALEVGEVRSLGARFERVWANGVRIK